MLIIKVENRHPNKENDFPKNILKYLKDLSFVTQTESEENKIIKLNESFIVLINYIIDQLILKKNENTDKDIKQNEDVYYELLSGFYLSELKRESDINYRANILEQILIND